MKKLIACILALVLVVSLVAVLGACNKNNMADFVIPEGGYDGSKVTITFISSMGQSYGTILDDYLEKFNELFPNITVKHERGGNYDSNRDVIKNKIVNNQAPNLAFCYSDHVALYNRSRAVVTLDDLIASQIEVKHADGTTEILGLTKAQKDDFIKTYYDEGKSFGDGKMYMLPFAKSTELMYYNESAFNEWGIQVPDHWFANDGKIGTASSDKTSMEYVLDYIKKQDPKSTPLGLDSGANWLITLFEQYDSGYTKATGTDHYLFDNETNYGYLTTLNRWYQSGYFTTKGILGGNTYTSSYFTSANSDEGKKSYLSIGSSAGAGNQVPSNDIFDVGVTIIPQAAANTKLEESKVISQGPNVCIFNSTNPQEVVASWLLAKFLITSAGFQARYGAEAGYLPVIESARDIEMYKEILDDPNTKDNIAGLAALTTLEYADKGALFVSPAFYGSSEARDQMEILLNAVVKLQGDAATVAAGVKKAFKDALAKCDY